MRIHKLVGLIAGLAGCNTILGYGNDPVLVEVDSGGGSDRGMNCSFVRAGAAFTRFRRVARDCATSQTIAAWYVPRAATPAERRRRGVPARPQTGHNVRALG